MCLACGVGAVKQSGQAINLMAVNSTGATRQQGNSKYHSSIKNKM